MPLTRFRCLALVAFIFLSALAAHAQTLDKGHRVLLERGLQIHALVFEDAPFDVKLLKEANFTGVNWGWKSKPKSLGPPPGGVTWSRWSSGPEEVTLKPDEQPYAASFIAWACADEQNLNDAAV